jgi:hypothetical protein
MGGGIAPSLTFPSRLYLQAFDNLFPVHSLDDDNLVAACLPFYDGYGRLFYAQHSTEEIDQLFIGFALFRRCCDFHLERTVAPARYFIILGIGIDPYR